MKSNTWGRAMAASNFSFPSPYPIVVLLIAILTSAAIAVLGSYALAAAIGVGVLALLLFLRQDQLAATLVIAVHLYVDWYLGLAAVAQVMTMILLFVFLLARSQKHPWVEPRTLWLWILFLLLAIFPATRGIDALDSAYYYLNVIFIALIIYWLGLVVGSDAASVRSLLVLLSTFATLIAIHTIIEGLTGIFLFKTSRYDASLADLSFFELSGTGVLRAEAFLLNPDSNAIFFAMMFLIPLGLFVSSSSLVKKIVYLVEMCLMLLALLLTYSTGSWIAAGISVFFFLLFVGSKKYRIIIPVLIFLPLVLMTFLFPAQVSAQFQHVGDSYEGPLRIGGWRTALNVIRANPLTGLGMGRNVYIVRADPYRVPDQFLPLYHPHNSYLEFMTQGGIPLLILFLLLMLPAFWFACRNWKTADSFTRSYLAGGLSAVFSLSINSLINTGWTYSPLAIIGWLLLGALSSPLLAKSLHKQRIQHVNTIE